MAPKTSPVPWILTLGSGCLAAITFAAFLTTLGIIASKKNGGGSGDGGSFIRKVLPFGGSGLEGLYFRIQIWSGNITQEHFYFTRDGQVYWGVPPGGLDHFDIDAAKEETPNLVGTWKIEGDKIIFVWPKEGERTMTFERVSDGNIELDGLFTKKVSRFDDGQELNGRYGWLGMAGGGTGAVVSAGRGLTFHENGSFSDQSVGGTSVDTQYGGGSARSESATSGTYEVSGNTLTLNHRDGRTTRHTVYPYGEREDEENPERINVDGAMMKYEGEP